MALVPGGSLKDRRKELAADPRRAAVLMEKVARGVQHAHEQGIIHRDLKPGNILLDAHGEPLVSDFGLAKFLDSNEDLTASGTMLGTVPYMAPEQLAGQFKKAAPSSFLPSIQKQIYDRSRGRFFGRRWKLFGRIPFEWVSLAMIIAMLIYYIALMHGAPSGVHPLP